MISGDGWLPRCPCNLALLWDRSWFLRGRYDAGEGAFYGVCQPECYISGRGLPLPISRLQLVNPSRLPPATLAFQRCNRVSRINTHEGFVQLQTNVDKQQPAAPSSFVSSFDIVSFSAG